MRYLLILLGLIVYSKDCQSKLCNIGEFQIYDSSSLESFIQLYGDCDTLKGRLHITFYEGNSINYLFDAVKRLDTLRISNTKLDSIIGFNNLISLDGFHISVNDNLQYIRGFSSLKNVDRYFEIRGNPKLILIEAFDSLKQIGKPIQRSHLGIWSNDKLDNLDFIRDVKFEGSLFSSSPRLLDNPSLNHCHVPTFCNIIDAGYYELFILRNGPGCQSVAEVKEACLTAIQDNDIEDKITIFPNPVASNLTLYGLKRESHYEIYTYDGRCVLRGLTNGKVDVSSCTNGLYVLRLYDEGGLVRVMKFVKE